MFLQYLPVLLEETSCLCTSNQDYCRAAMYSSTCGPFSVSYKGTRSHRGRIPSGTWQPCHDCLICAETTTVNRECTTYNCHDPWKSGSLAACTTWEPMIPCPNFKTRTQIMAIGLARVHSSLRLVVIIAVVITG